MRIVTTGTVFHDEMTPFGPRVTRSTVLRGYLAVRLMLRMTCRTAGKFLLMCSPLGTEILSLVLMACGAELLGNLAILLKTNILRLMRSMAQ